MARTARDRRSWADDGAGLAAQPAKWVQAAKLALKQLAWEMRYLSANDVWPRIKQLGGGDPIDHNAMAGVFGWGQRTGLVESTSESVMADRDGRHSNRITVWRSLIYRPPTPEQALWRQVMGI